MSNENVISDSVINELLQQQQSCCLATLDEAGQAHASYSPFAFNIEKNELYLILSELSEHCLNLLARPGVSVLIMEDEADSKQIFARRRVQYAMQARECVDTTEHETIINALKQRHGGIIDLLNGLTDFHVFKLVSNGGRYIEGFGKAYTSDNSSLTEGFTHIGPEQIKKQ